MKKMNRVLLGFLLLCASVSLAQDMHINWGEEIVLNNKLDGSMDYIIDANSKYIYTMFTDLGGRGKLRKIVAFDKNTMKRKKDVGLFGFAENKKEKKLKKKLNYYDTYVYEDVIYVFWTQYSKNKKEYFVESFNSELKQLAKLKKVFEQTSDKDSDKAASSMVLSNKDVKGGKLLIGGELNGNAGEPIKIAFKELNSDLTYSNAVQLELPFALVREKKKGLFSSGQHSGLSSSYSYGDDGFLHIRTAFSYTRKEIKKMKKEGTYKDRISLLYSSVDLSSGKLNTKEIKFENKKLLKTRRSIENNAVKFYGFFSDTKKDEAGTTTHGIFYAELNSDYSVKKVKFNYFSKKQLKELFKDDDDSQMARRTCSSCMPGKGCFAKKGGSAQKEGKDAAITDDYGIEYSINSGDGVYLFCSRERTYVVQHCSTDRNTGIRTCYNVYHNLKSNVTAFSLDENGELKWSSNLDRFIHYRSRSSSTLYINDVKVVMTEAGFYVIYADEHNKKKEGKKYDKKRRPFKYAFFDLKTGKYSKREYNVNSVNAKKKERKTVTAAGVTVFENQFYTTYTRLKLKPQWWWIGWAYRTPGMLKGKGYFGRIEILD